MKAKIIIIIFLAILVVLLAMISLFFSPKTPPQPTSSPLATTTPRNFPISSPKETVGFGDPNAAREISSKMLKRFPLTASLPYETSSYIITYTGPLKLNVKLKNTSVSESLINGINQWIASKGVDPATHEIIYK